MHVNYIIAWSPLEYRPCELLSRLQRFLPICLQSVPDGIHLVHEEHSAPLRLQRTLDLRREKRPIWSVSFVFFLFGHMLLGWTLLLSPTLQ